MKLPIALRRAFEKLLRGPVYLHSLKTREKRRYRALTERVMAYFLDGAYRVMPGAERASRAPLDAEIERVKSAMRRREAQLSDLRQRTPRGVCCPSCYHGAAYGRLADQQERTGAWLTILLRKRGTPADAQLAEALRVGAWP